MIKMLPCLLLLLILTGCKSDEQTSAKQEKKKQVLMSRETSIGQSNIDVVSINISTSVCGMRENNIKKAVKNLQGVVDAEVDADIKIAKVKYDKRVTDPASIRNVISKAGYDADDVMRDKKAYEKLDECCKIETHT